MRENQRETPYSAHPNRTSLRGILKTTSAPLIGIEAETKNENSPDLQSTSQSDNKAKGIICMLLCNFLFACSFLLQRVLFLHFEHISPNTQNFSRGICVMLFASYVYFFHNQHSIAGVDFKGQRRTLILSMLNMGVVIYLQASVTLYLRISTTLIFWNIYPIVMCFIAVRYLGEKAHRLDNICIGLSLLGSILVSKPFSPKADEKDDQPIGILIATVLIFGRTWNNISFKLLTKSIDFSLLHLLYGVTVFVMAVLDCTINDLAIGIHGRTDFLLVALTGVLFYSMQALLIKSIEICDLVILSPFIYSSIPFSFLMGVFVHESHDLWDVSGAVIIFTINVYRSYILYLEYKEQKQRDEL